MARRIKSKSVKKATNKGNEKLQKVALSHRIVKEDKIRKEIKAVKTLNALARLELIKKGLDNHPKDAIQLRKRNKYGSIEAHFKSDSRVCKERKVRRAEIMAKTRGRGLRVRRANWTADSFIQCRS